MTTTLIKSLVYVGFSKLEATILASGFDDVIGMTETRADEIANQLWFSRWHQGDRLLVWESQSPGPDYFVASTSIADALNERLAPGLQIEMRSAPDEMLKLYSRAADRKSVLFDNGSDYKLVGYEYSNP